MLPSFRELWKTMDSGKRGSGKFNRVKISVVKVLERGKINTESYCRREISQATCCNVRHFVVKCPTYLKFRRVRRTWGICLALLEGQRRVTRSIHHTVSHAAPKLMIQPTRCGIRRGRETIACILQIRTDPIFSVTSTPTLPCDQIPSGPNYVSDTCVVTEGLPSPWSQHFRKETCTAMHKRSAELYTVHLPRRYCRRENDELRNSWYLHIQDL